MNDNYRLQERYSTITFNPYKHHLRFLRMMIKTWKERPRAEVRQEISCIGSNLIDLYYGELTLENVFKEITEFAGMNNITSSEKLEEWLAPLEYRKIKLSDDSMWVIKQGQNPARFLHIHPGKYSPLTIRVKASTLKTVIALQVSEINIEQTDLEFINRIRTNMLNLSPVKSLTTGKGISKLMISFNSL